MMNKVVFYLLMLTAFSSYAESPIIDTDMSVSVKEISNSNKEKIFRIHGNKSALNTKIKEIELICLNTEATCSFEEKNESFLKKEVILKVRAEEEILKLFEIKE